MYHCAYRSLRQKNNVQIILSLHTQYVFLFFSFSFFFFSNILIIQIFIRYERIPCGFFFLLYLFFCVCMCVLVLSFTAFYQKRCIMLSFSFFFNLRDGFRSRLFLLRFLWILYFSMCFLYLSSLRYLIKDIVNIINKNRVCMYSNKPRTAYSDSFQSA